jgi:hypothetical protein
VGYAVQRSACAGRPCIDVLEVPESLLTLTEAFQGAKQLAGWKETGETYRLSTGKVVTIHGELPHG